MVSVEQIHALEERIERALAFIAGLRAENGVLKGKLDAAEAERLRAEERADAAGLRVLELEESAETFKEDQARIEEGIIHALEKLDAFEDLVLHSEVAEEAAPKAKATPASPPASRPQAPRPSPSPRSAPMPKADPEPGVPPASEAEAADLSAEQDPEGQSTTSEGRQTAVDELDIF
jgi:hypothetical protein